MKNALIVVMIVLATGTVQSPPIFAQSPYATSWKKDGILIGSGIGLTSIGLYYYYNITPFTEDEINDLSKQDVNCFDRSAISNWSPTAGRVSDALLITFAALPASLFLSKNIRSDFITISTLYVETYLFAISINSLTKGLTQRTRPFVYNPDVAMHHKTKADARRSFYSGHTTVAFASAVLTAKIYSDYFPDSKWHETIWCTSLLAASTIAYLRYEAGIHYPTDSFVGAFMGSLTGYLIPSTHKKNDDSGLSILPSWDKKQYQITLHYRF